MVSKRQDVKLLLHTANAWPVDGFNLIGILELKPVRDLRRHLLATCNEFRKGEIYVKGLLVRYSRPRAQMTSVLVRFGSPSLLGKPDKNEPMEPPQGV